MNKADRGAHERFIRKMAEQYACEYWGVEITCPIKFVNREWKRTFAYFQYNTEDGTCAIVMSHKENAKRELSEVLATLKHELAHWYLWSVGQPYGDGDPEFVAECLRIEASISGSQKAQKALRKYCAEIGVSVVNG